MTIGIDAEVIGIPAVGELQPRVAIVRIAIFDLGIGVGADLLFDARAEAIAVEVEMLAGLAVLITGDQIEPLVGIAALGVDQRRRRRLEARADAQIQVAARLDAAIADRKSTRLNSSH